MIIKNKSIIRLSTIGVAFLFFGALISGCVYMKMNPPADADKTAADGTCYMATAANMLAGAGYGDGTSLQARAVDIYNEMKAHLDLGGGWTDAAITWWLGSSYNTWASNPYQVVTVYGNKIPKYPWANSNGPMFFGNQLRDCNLVGLSISWPTEGSSIGTGGHAITCWGDNGFSKKQLNSNPTKVRVTDSDKDTGGDVQVYTWDSYTSPNPSGPNEGSGWYMNYSTNHPYLKHIIVLSPIDIPGLHVQKVTGSYRIHQDQEEPAIDLHYIVGTDVEILNYLTEIDHPAKPPTIKELGTPRKELEVDWDFTEPAEYCTWVTITTEFMLSNWNAITYKDVHFTYEDSGPVYVPSLEWEMKTPRIPKPEAIPNVTGGYVVGSFEVDLGMNYPLEYRFIHEYSFDQDPQEHEFLLSGEGDNVYVQNFRFGHSYGYLSSEELWQFGEKIGEWLYEDPEEYPLEEVPPMPMYFKLPYPPGDV